MSDVGKMTLTSWANVAIENISFTISSDNDSSDWINGFFVDYDRSYGEEEVIGVYTNLMAGIPFTISFTSKALKEFTLENIKNYVVDMQEDPEMMLEEDKEVFKDSFIDPMWLIEVSIKWKVIGSAYIPFENTEITEYINSI